MLKWQLFTGDFGDRFDIENMFFLFALNDMILILILNINRTSMLNLRLLKQTIKRIQKMTPIGKYSFYRICMNRDMHIAKYKMTSYKRACSIEKLI